MRLPISLLLTLLVLGSQTVAPASNPAAARIDEFVRAEMKRQQVPGVAVAIVRRGTVEKAEGYGFANVEHMVPVTPDTIFQSGSLGKMFTAASAFSTVSTVGTIIPNAPISVAFWISLSVASGTRMNGMALAPRQAQIIFATSE